MKKNIIGLSLSFCSSFMWATTYIAVKILMREKVPDVDPETLSALRFLFGGVLIFTICLITDRKGLFNFAARDYLAMAALGLFAYVGMSVFLFKGMQYTSAMNSSLIMGASPVLAMLAGVAAGIRISLKQLAGMIVSTVGALIVVGVISGKGFHFESGNLGGDGLVLLSALSWAISIVLGAKMLSGKKNVMAVTAWSMLAAAFILVVMSLFRWESVNMPSRPQSWLLVCYLGVFSTAIAFFSWNAALSMISMNVVNIMQYLTQVMTLIMAWLLLGETLSPFKMLGVVMVLGGVAFASVKNKIK